MTNGTERVEKPALAFILVDLSQASFVVWLHVTWQMEKNAGKILVMFIWLTSAKHLGNLPHKSD